MVLGRLGRAEQECNVGEHDVGGGEGGPPARCSPSGRGRCDPFSFCAGRGPGPSAPGVPKKWARKWPV